MVYVILGVILLSICLGSLKETQIFPKVSLEIHPTVGSMQKVLLHLALPWAQLLWAQCSPFTSLHSGVMSTNQDKARVESTLDSIHV